MEPSVDGPGRPPEGALVHGQPTVERGWIVSGGNMNCAKCGKKNVFGRDGIFVNFGYVPELRAIQHFMKQNRLLCKDCREKLSGK